MASLIKQHGWYYVQFYDRHRSPQRRQVALKTKTKRTAEQLKRNYEDQYASGDFDPWNPLAVGQQKALKGKRVVYGVALYVSMLRPALDALVVVSTPRPRQALMLYRERWQIETMFKAFKTRGFQFKQTHLRAPDRPWTLVALMAIVYVWAYHAGHFIAHGIKPIRIKAHSSRH